MGKKASSTAVNELTSDAKLDAVIDLLRTVRDSAHSRAHAEDENSFRDRLITLPLLNSALEKVDVFKKNPSLDAAIELLFTVSHAMLMNHGNSLLQNRSYKAGKKLAEARQQGGRNRKKFATEEQKSWLKDGLKAYPATTRERFKKISGYVYNTHGYKSNAKTVRTRLKELGLLESA